MSKDQEAQLAYSERYQKRDIRLRCVELVMGRPGTLGLSVDEIIFEAEQLAQYINGV